METNRITTEEQEKYLKELEGIDPDLIFEHLTSSGYIQDKKIITLTDFERDAYNINKKKYKGISDLQYLMNIYKVASDKLKINLKNKIK